MYKSVLFTTTFLFKEEEKSSLRSVRWRKGLHLVVFVKTFQPMLGGGEDATVPLSASTNSDGLVIYISRPLLPLQASWVRMWRLPARPPQTRRTKPKTESVGGTRSSPKGQVRPIFTQSGQEGGSGYGVIYMYIKNTGMLYDGQDTCLFLQGTRSNHFYPRPTFIH